MRQVTAIGLQVFCDADSLLRHLLKADIDAIDEKNYFYGLLAAVVGLKGSNFRGRFVIKESEVLLLQAGNGFARFAGYLNIQIDRPRWGSLPNMQGRGGGVLGIGRASAKKRQEKKEAVDGTHDQEGFLHWTDGVQCIMVVLPA